jgi:hypothetical protein
MLVNSNSECIVLLSTGHIQFPLDRILYEIEELMMKLFDEMAMMMKFDRVVVVDI